MKELDVRGLSCPEPVLLVKNEIDNNKNENLRILINEAHTVKNIEIFLSGKNIKFKTSTSGFEYIIEVK